MILQKKSIGRHVELYRMTLACVNNKSMNQICELHHFPRGIYICAYRLVSCLTKILNLFSVS